MRRASGRRASGVAIGLAAVLAVTGCSGAGEDDPASSGSASTAPNGATDPGGVASEVRLGRVEGDLRPRVADRVTAEVGVVVDQWIDAAYGGSYPRTDFSTAFDGFTDGAAEQAEEQSELMTNSDLGDRVESVTFTERTIVVDTVGRGKRAAGATARVKLSFETAGEVPATYRVKGRLLLTPQRQAWKVFGFDVRKGER